MPFIVVAVILFILFYSEVYKRKKILVLKENEKEERGLKIYRKTMQDKFRVMG